MHLNANTLLALLAVYRGTLENELNMGSRRHDLMLLGQAGLVVRGTTRPGTTYQTTARGDAMVKSLLSFTANSLATVPKIDAAVYSSNCQENNPGLTLSDVERDTARLKAGAFFIVADVGVKLNRLPETPDNFESIWLTKVRMKVHAPEALATDHAIELARASIGSRYIVLQAIAMHEVETPVKSTRL